MLKYILPILLFSCTAKPVALSVPPPPVQFTAEQIAYIDSVVANNKDTGSTFDLSYVLAKDIILMSDSSLGFELQDQGDLEFFIETELEKRN